MGKGKYDNVIRQRMQKVLAESGLNDTTAAYATGLNMQTIRHIRAGDQSFSNDTVISFADGMNVSVDYLLGRVSEKDTGKYYSDRKLFLKKVYREIERIECAKERVEKHYQGMDELAASDRHGWDVYIDEAPYPYNLIYAVLCTRNYDFEDRRKLSFLPVDDDIEKGIDTALSTLSEREKTVIERRFKENKGLEEIGKEFGVTRERIRQLEAKALRKLRAPQNRMLLIYGNNGFNARKRREKAEREYKKARQLEQETKRIYGRIRESAPGFVEPDEDKPRDRPLEELGLSVRSYNALKRAGLRTENEIIKYYVGNGYEGLLKIRNLGRKSADEIVYALGLDQCERRNRDAGY